MKRIYFLTSLALLFGVTAAFSQAAQDDKNAVTFEELYDEPYAVNKLFVGFQPLYAEVSPLNTNAGFGLLAHYYHRDKFNIQGQVRMTYGPQFYDYNRQLATNNSDVDNVPTAFHYFELGGTYHIKDSEATGKTKMTLYKNSYKGNKWASRVPLQTEVPAKLRKIYGARLGAIVWNSTTGLNAALQKQNLTNADLVNSSGEGLPLTRTVGAKQEVFNVFSNIQSAAVYLGGSMTRIRNVAVAFDNYEGGLDDGILNLYFDIVYAPMLALDDVQFNNLHYSVNALKMNPLGFRIGMDGKFNRVLSWGYGGEIGYRPSIKGRSFYTMFRIALPMFGTNLENKVESFGK
ncbi:MAG TPA: hypothetical protein VFE50_01505 [Cyclobacteriaceae bacterium]|nr:hypothetical protein [Cyclobacteriaceae bacterium]